MNILRLIAGNWAQGPQSQRFPDRQAPTADYRGHVVNDPHTCVACGICTQVCVSAAIELRPDQDSCAWIYDPARCTFCGFCVLHCPVDALGQAGDRGPCTHRPGEQECIVVIEYPRCPECGKAALPHSESLTSTAFGQLSADLRARTRLCERCRRQATAEVMRKSFGTVSDTPRRNHAR